MCAGSVAPNQISRDPQTGQTGQNRAKPGKTGCVVRSCFFIVLNPRANAVFSFFFWFSLLRMAPNTIFCEFSQHVFFGFHWWEWLRTPLLLNAPGGLPRLKDNEHRAETYVFLMFFSQFYRCSGGSSRSQKTMNTVHKTGAESDRLASTFFCYFWLFFYWFWRVCLKRQWIPCRNLCFFIFFSQFHRCAGRPPEAKRQWKPCRNFTKKRPFWKVEKICFQRSSTKNK